MIREDQEAITSRKIGHSLTPALRDSETSDDDVDEHLSASQQLDVTFLLNEFQEVLTDLPGSTLLL